MPYPNSVDSISGLSPEDVYAVQQIVAQQQAALQAGGTQQVALPQTAEEYAQRAGIPTTSDIPVQVPDSSSSSGVLTGLGIVGAGATIAAYCKGKGEGKGIWKAIKDGYKSMAKWCTKDATKNLKSNPMNKFTYTAKDGTKVFIENGKVTKILRKGESKTINTSTQIQDFINGHDDIKTLIFADVKSVMDAGKKIKLNKYSYDMHYKYEGKDVKLTVTDGKVTKVNGVDISSNPEQLLKDNFKNDTDALKTIEEQIKAFEKDPFTVPKDSKITSSAENLKVENYSWSDGKKSGVVNRKPNTAVYENTEVTEVGEFTELTEAQRNAYLQDNSSIDANIKSIIEHGHASNVNMNRCRRIDQNGNTVVLDKDGNILSVKLKDKYTVDGKEYDFLSPTSKNKEVQEAYNSWLYAQKQAGVDYAKQMKDLANSGEYGTWASYVEVK